jgi:hypothetical protein
MSLVAATAGAQTGPERPPLAACTAAAPMQGEVLSGVVLEVIDSQTICVARGPLPSEWVRVRVADPQVSRGAMMAAVFARRIDCVVTRIDGDGVRATCLADRTSVGALASAPEALAQAASWR